MNTKIRRSNNPIIRDTKKKITSINKKEIKAFDETQSNLNRAEKKNEKLDLKMKMKIKYNTRRNENMNKNHQLKQMPRYKPITKQMLSRFNEENQFSDALIKVKTAHLKENELENLKKLLEDFQRKKK